MNVKRGLTCVVIVSCAGCASILNEKTQTINVRTSNNAAITAEADGKSFTTPGTVTVMRQKAALTVSTTTPGCAATTNVNSEVDGKFWINILSGGFFGSSTDYGTDKMWRYADPIVISCGS